MRLTDLEIREISADIPQVTGGTYQVSVRRALLCRLSTDEGLTSEVCIGNQKSYGDDLKACLRGRVRESIVGLDPLMTTDLWRRLFASATGIGRPDAMRALSIVDVCAWDLKGQAFGQPIWKLIGGGARRIPIVAIGGYYETSTDESGIRAEMERLKSRGFGGVKFKVGALPIEEDAERVRIAREAAGPGFILIVDSNMAWTPRDAIRFAELVLPYDPAWLEEPLRWHNINRGMRELRFKTGIRVAAGQSELSTYDCFGMITDEAVDVINVSATRAGGITAWTWLAAAAAMADVDMAQVAEPHVALHLMAGIANPTCVECYGDPERDPFWENLYLDRPQPADGFVEVPDKPGLGLTLDPDAVERYAIEPWS